MRKEADYPGLWNADYLGFVRDLANVLDMIRMYVNGGENQGRNQGLVQLVCPFQQCGMWWEPSYVFDPAYQMMHRLVHLRLKNPHHQQQGGDKQCQQLTCPYLIKITNIRIIFIYLNNLNILIIYYLLCFYLIYFWLFHRSQ